MEKVAIKVLNNGDTTFTVVAYVGLETLVREVVRGPGGVDRALDSASALLAFYVQSRGVDAVNLKVLTPCL